MNSNRMKAENRVYLHIFQLSWILLNTHFKFNFEVVIRSGEYFEFEFSFHFTKHIKSKASTSRQQ